MALKVEGFGNESAHYLASDFLFVETIYMLTMEIILCLAAAGNLWWGFWNFRHMQRTKRECSAVLVSADQIKMRAVALMDAAQKASTISQDHKVCSTCNRIVVKHSTDENGKTTCVNCATDLARLVQ